MLDLQLHRTIYISITSTHLLFIPRRVFFATYLHICLKFANETLPTLRIKSTIFLLQKRGWKKTKCMLVCLVKKRFQFRYNAHRRKVLACTKTQTHIKYRIAIVMTNVHNKIAPHLNRQRFVATTTAFYFFARLKQKRNKHPESRI